MTVRRVIFLCPADDSPTGGIKVIYRHAEIVEELGVDAFVLHPFDHAFRCSWFDHKVRLLRSLELDPRTDFVVVPEIWAPIFGAQCLARGLRYGIMVQNGYLTHPVLSSLDDAKDHDEIYRGADLVLSISTDTTRMIGLNYPGINRARIVPVQYSIGPAFRDTDIEAGRDRLITFMPRKMADHAARVVFALRNHLPRGWTIAPIHNMSEGDCAAMLSRSSVFLSFSEFEGLPLPPLEAAIAGNLVVGYTGQGAKDYWDEPIFHEIQQGDVISFVRTVADLACRIDAGRVPHDLVARRRRALTARYSAAAERSSLAALIERIELTFAPAVTPDLSRREACPAG